MRLCLLFLLTILLAAASPSAELQADGAIDTRIGLSRKWDVVLHNRARVRAANNEWYDVSVVPTFRYQAHPSLQLSTGSFFTWIETQNVWRNVVRPFVAIEPSMRKGRVRLAARTGYERFMVVDGTDFNRYRERFRVIGNGSWTPYASVEFFFTNDGLATTRYGTGVRKDIGKRDGVEFFYWYEARDFAGPGVRHMLSMTFHLKFTGLAPDF